MSPEASCTHLSDKEEDLNQSHLGMSPAHEPSCSSSFQNMYFLLWDGLTPPSYHHLPIVLSTEIRTT